MICKCPHSGWSHLPGCPFKVENTRLAKLDEAIAYHEAQLAEMREKREAVLNEPVDDYDDGTILIVERDPITSFNVLSAYHKVDGKWRSSMGGTLPWFEVHRKAVKIWRVESMVEES